VLECRLAAMVLAHRLSAATAAAAAAATDMSSPAHGLNWQQVSELQQVEAALLTYQALRSDTGTGSTASGVDRADQLVQAVQDLLPEAAYSLDQVGLQQTSSNTRSPAHLN